MLELDLEAGGTRLHLREWGDERRPLLLFWPGLATTATRAKAASAGPAVDAPGFGVPPQNRPSELTDAPFPILLLAATRPEDEPRDRAIARFCADVPLDLIPIPDVAADARRRGPTV